MNNENNLSHPAPEAGEGQEIKIGSKWNYDRSLCNSTNTSNLTVKEIDGNIVQFEEKMAYKGYDIAYFRDGKTFTPAEPTNIRDNK